MAVAALVLGIFGTILSWFPAALLGVPLALVGVILGILARKNAQETQQPTGMATAGLVISIIGMVLGILLSAMCVMCVNNAKHNFEKMANDPEFQKQMQQRNHEFDDAMKKALEESNKQKAQPEAPPPAEAAPTKK